MRQILELKYFTTLLSLQEHRNFSGCHFYVCVRSLKARREKIFVHRLKS